MPLSVNSQPRISGYSVVLLFVQFAALAALAASARIFPISTPGMILFWGGAFVGLWALVAMRRSKLRIQPEVAAGATLITSGPYRIIRNPMYFSVISISLGWLVERPMTMRLLLWVILVTALILKLRFEEKLLANAFPNFKYYAKSTKRLIPFIW